MTERQSQIIIIKHLKTRCAKDATWWAVPNGIATTPISKKRAKEEGLRAGVPDLCFLKAGKPLYIELKADVTGTENGRVARISDDQVRMHREITNAGGRVAICFGQDEAIKQLEEWGVLIQAKVQAA